MLVLLIILPLVTIGQPVTGKWKTIDDTSGEEKSIVEIFERDGRIYGKIVEIFRQNGEDPDPVCDKCPEDDDRYNDKVVGMEIIRDLIRSGEEATHGTILDPEVGKIYRCKLWIDEGTLRVRGYWGPFFRTQTWLSVQR